ncbi:MAG: monofunctional biosynthetic peptidoglycan transglycosylase [Shewanella xiamenensis]|uniref:monofunctional biosynthetic peptidoglycan transglycosylase n=1 Tax=Shewanella xiamenensis TaxID=332186 RepID=UPI001C4F8FB0|nr:monofunctional biosynthetic peptidoglycan transglycosylase [Shewanella xiamenensis]MBW0280310.1 monofunctional biosynthetic peptidoglycan transglycosylase [Shewanella xiamenensis]MCD8549967.1 monofunctional biosynthetic peptidoglycan transglycosylase [Shewanella xiamenensis]MCD8561378.1 monofunctional biosynthetic peptidoglycan transglycosylase [Shewanella xiamenensis]MCT8872913.1 monofunctional biosynthetic peptidoglycan transglycosylase [Shewanella xiamenensis]UWH43013.1 monofunctional bi
MTAPLYAMRDHVNRPQVNHPTPKPKMRGVKRVFTWLAKLVLGLFFASILSVVLLSFIDPPMWSWRIERALFPPAPITEVRHQWRSLEQISPELQLAVIAAEDQKFAGHSGFDLDAISSAIEYNQKGKKVRGASTLSQQAAKNLFMWSSRSFIRKGIEAWFTLLMELFWDKARILEVYLNIVEFGPGIYGAEAAAKHYFGKSAAKLTRYEASLLAAVLPNPWRYKVSPPSSYVEQRSVWIRKQMRQLGEVTLKKVGEAQ